MSSNSPNTNGRYHVKQRSTTNHPLSVQIILFSRCRRRDATVYRNSSWRLARRKRMSRKSAKLWRTQCGNLKQGPRLPNQALRRTSCRVKLWDQTTSSLLVRTFLVSATWTSRAREPSREACQKHTERKVRQRSVNKKEKGCNLLCPWFWPQLVARLFLPCAFQSLCG